MTDRMSDNFDCTDYVITHREYPIDEYDMYKVLCVGTYRNAHMLSDQDGDSISAYNDRINEITGLYWIWKNTDDAYVGLSHYRRFFRYNGRRIQKEDVRKILTEDGYDIILTKKKHMPWKVYRGVSHTVGEKLSINARNVFREEIERHQPSYVAAFDKVMNMTWQYTCNMFITSRKIMNEFCEWLFSFLLDATDRIDVTGLPFYPTRVAGYYCEAIWAVWLMKQNYKVLELPIEEFPLEETPIEETPSEDKHGNAPFFSVIIPSHNGHDHIATALESVKKQTFKDYELIVVCDACEDDTAEIARSYGAKVMNVDFHRDGLTRNAGLDVAKGEWVLFLDDDDWYMHELVFEMLHDVIGKQGEQVLNFSYVRKNNGYFEQTTTNMFVSCCCRCCRRDFIGDTRFSDDPYGSDVRFFMDLMAKKPDVVFWNTPMYYYNDNERSINEYLKQGGQL